MSQPTRFFRSHTIQDERNQYWWHVEEKHRGTIMFHGHPLMFKASKWFEANEAFLAWLGQLRDKDKKFITYAKAS